MAFDFVVQLVDLWVSQYIAAFCLLSLLAWGGGAYVFLDRWNKQVRDASMYFVAISVLTTVLALRPTRGDALFWAPITWFSFAMLLMFELLWITFLTQFLIRSAQSLPGRFSQSRGLPRQ